MRVFTCVDHDGFGLPVASVVVANDDAEAINLLRAEIRAHGLDYHKPFFIREINAKEPRAFILQDGDR